jgi:hypothetical protein
MSRPGVRVCASGSGPVQLVCGFALRAGVSPGHAVVGEAVGGVDEAAGEGGVGFRAAELEGGVSGVGARDRDVGAFYAGVWGGVC